MYHSSSYDEARCASDLDRRERLSAGDARRLRPRGTSDGESATEFRDAIVELADDELDLDGIIVAGGVLSIDDSWVVVDLPRSFVDPVVIAGPASFDGTAPLVVRVRNVTSDSFEIHLQEWEYLDGDHPLEDVSYLVLEAGIHTTNSGTTIEVGTLMAGGAKEQRASHSFSHGFVTTPWLFATGQTRNGGDAVSVRVDNLDASGFQVILDEQESKNDGHANLESVGYIALSGTPADTATASFGLTSVNVPDEWTPVAGYELSMREEKSDDNEVNHAAELVNVLTIDRDHDELLFAQDVDYNGADTASLRFRLP